MKICNIQDIKEEVVLARDIITDDYQILLSKDTILKVEYIDRLIEMNIKEVYIKEDKNVEIVKMVLMKEELEQSFKSSIQTILEKHIYQNSEELSLIGKTADHIISSILQEEEVIEKVYDIKERNADIYDHSINLCSLATLTALKLGLSNEIVHDIGVACLLHDLGLRYVTIHYENQNIDQLQDFEYAEYKKHPVYGYTALSKESWISEKSKNMILMHHEHIDGSGYPLKSTDIPFEVKIITVCDVFDEMICGVGHERSKVHEAIEYLKVFKGKKYDESVVNIFLSFTAVYPVGTKIITSNGDFGVIMKQNKGFSDRPIIKIIKDKDGKQIGKDYIIDLLKENSVFIKEVVN